MSEVNDTYLYLHEQNTAENCVPLSRFPSAILTRNIKFYFTRTVASKVHLPGSYELALEIEVNAITLYLRFRNKETQKP